MKELSIEEKAKRYDEAIKRAKAMLPVAANREEIYNSVITIFPELQESEDERIRKALYLFVEAYGAHANYEVTREEMLAWLEKKGEQKDILENAVLDSNKDGLIADTIRCKIEKQGEQKYQYNSRPRYIGEEELLGEQKPAAWSDDELDSITAAINNLEYLKNNYAYHQMGLEPAITFLKSLKERYTWKPSDRQMNVLEYYMHTLACNEHKEILFGLYQDLKKLKE